MSNRYYGAGLRVAQTHAIPSPPPLHPTNPPPPLPPPPPQGEKETKFMGVMCYPTLLILIKYIDIN